MNNYKKCKNKGEKMGAKKQKEIDLVQDSSQNRQIPAGMKKSKALAYNQNHMAMERTELSKIRTELAFTNTKLSMDRTHLAYLRTIVSLIGSGGTVYNALPLLGVSETFTTILTIFLFLAAIYFIYMDATTYPKMKKQLQEMKKQADEFAIEQENLVYQIDDE